jgi:hypothetical protein
MSAKITRKVLNQTDRLAQRSAARRAVLIQMQNHQLFYSMGSISAQRKCGVARRAQLSCAYADRFPIALGIA